MATIYKADVEVTSAFLNYNESEIREVIEKALKEFQDKKTGLKLESIKVNVTKIA